MRRRLGAKKSHLSLSGIQRAIRRALQVCVIKLLRFFIFIFVIKVKICMQKYDVQLLYQELDALDSNYHVHDQLF